MFPTILVVDAKLALTKFFGAATRRQSSPFLGRDLLIMAPKNFNSDSELPYVSSDA